MTYCASLFSVGGQLAVATGYGVLHRMTWEGKMIRGLNILLHQLTFTNGPFTPTKGY